MRILRGISISPGYARGTVFIYDPLRAVELPRFSIEPGEVATEHERFHTGLEKAAEELRAVEKKALAELGRAEASIFSAHLAMLRDKSFIQKVRERIASELVNVEHALDQEIADLTRLLSEVESEYIRERAKDVKDIGRRVLKHLGHGAGDALKSLPAGTVLITEELLPSDTLDIDRPHLAAFVTERGGGTSHAAILARSMDIPAITGVANATTAIPNGADVLVDGNAGKVTVEPSSNNVSRFRDDERHYDDESTQADESEGLESITQDGVEVRLLANVARLGEVDAVRRHNLEGIGLFRTEYLFMETDQPPDKKWQSSVYRAVIEKLPTLPVTIRTLDLGGDKKPAFVERDFEHNPSLAARGLRFSLAHRGLLRTQIDAILESGPNANVRLLFPMVLSSADFREAIAETKAAACREGVKGIPPLGAMIETPSVLFELDEIFALADFVSIGTNDLVQFMLAADRSTADLASEEMILHPSVLRAIAKVVEAARKHNRPVCVCGEAAGNPRMACLLIGLGVRELSMSADRAARVRLAIRLSHAFDLERLARQALESESFLDVKRLLGELTIT